MAVDLLQQLEALVTEIETILQAHDPDYKVRRFVAWQNLDGADASRDAVVGNPVRYCEVLYAGEADNAPISPVTSDPSGAPHRTPNVFAVTVWHGWEAAGIDDDFSTTSQKAFMDVLFAREGNASGTPIGLISHLRKEPCINDASGFSVGEMSVPIGVILDFDATADISESLTHFSTFTVILTTTT